VPDAIARKVAILATRVALVLRDERIRRGWSVRDLAARAGVSPAAAHAAENGERVSLEMYIALADALGLAAEVQLTDPRRRQSHPHARAADPVHAAMGELEGARLRRLGRPVAVDEPYQHYQFAGRADLLAWDLQSAALLHIENRTRFPNLGETAGSYNAKRTYMPRVLAERLGVRRRSSVTNVIVALWSAEVLHVVRLRSETFRALCPDDLDAFTAWWLGLRASRPVAAHDPRMSSDSTSGWRHGAGDRRTVLAVRPLAAGVVVLALLIAYPPVRTAYLSAALLAELLELPVRPLTWHAPAPERISTTYGVPSPDRMDVYYPSGSTPDRSHSAVILSLGIHPLPLDHPDVIRIAEGIARVGVVVAVPESTALRETRVTQQEPERLADAFLVVSRLPDVDPDRIGMAGFSAGASIALVAAADPRIAGGVAFLSAFGAYADAETLIVDVATRSVERGGFVSPWPAEPGIRRDVAALVVNALPPSPDRDRLAVLLDPVIASDQPPAGPDPDIVASLADGDIRAIYRVFTASTRPEARAALGDASEALRMPLAAISPIRVGPRIRAPTYLLHGRGDVAIPVTHAHMIADALSPGTLRRLTVFELFQHGQPGKEGLDVDDLPDLGQLYGYLYDLVALAG
jgi:dienelactone hydrolase/transcriptional regulator with XRE-family HTH domain